MLGNVRVFHTYKYADVCSVEVLKDGTSISTTNRGSQLAGAAIGELAFGPVGMLIGGLSGSRTTREMISNVSLKVVVDCKDQPVYRVTFLAMKKAVRANDPIVKQLTARLEHFHTLVANVIRAQARIASAPAPAAISHTEEIERLWRLKEMGALSPAEFEAQQAAYLRGPATSLAQA